MSVRPLSRSPGRLCPPACPSTLTVHPSALTVHPSALTVRPSVRPSDRPAARPPARVPAKSPTRWGERRVSRRTRNRWTYLPTHGRTSGRRDRTDQRERHGPAFRVHDAASAEQSDDRPGPAAGFRLPAAGCRLPDAVRRTTGRTKRGRRRLVFVHFPIIRFIKKNRSRRGRSPQGSPRPAGRPDGRCRRRRST